MKLLNPSWVCIDPAGSPSISKVYSVIPVRATLEDYFIEKVETQEVMA